MSLPYFPLYAKDFQSKAAYLSLEEDGAYNRLLRIMWMQPDCTFPDDDAWIRRKIGVDAATYTHVVMVVIDEFFIRSEGRLSNARLSIEFHKTKEAHEKRVLAGKLGGKNKALKNNDKVSSNAKAKLKQSPDNQNQNHIIKEEAKASKKKTGNRGCTIPDDFEPDLEFAMSEGLTNSQARREAANFKDWWKAKTGANATKKDWPATWRNWIRRNADRATTNSQDPKANKWDVAADELKQDLSDPFAIPDRSASNQPQMKLISPEKGH